MTAREELALVAKIKKELGLATEEETLLAIYNIWVFGAIRNLTHLGSLQDDRIEIPDGIKFWEQIDQRRSAMLKIDTLAVVICLVVDQFVVPEARDAVAKRISIYFQESNRQAYTKALLNQSWNRDSGKGFG